MTAEEAVFEESMTNLLLVENIYSIIEKYKILYADTKFRLAIQNILFRYFV